MNRSFYFTTILGIPIEINYTWFIVFLLFTWTLAQNYFPMVMPGSPVIFYWLLGAVFTVLFFATLLAHELSHSIVALKNDLPISGITLFIFGGVAHITREPQTPAVEFKMAVAGPACSITLSLIFYILTVIFFNLNAPLALTSITSYLSLINLMVGVFNLIPGFPLDGGRILRSVIWSITGDLKGSTRIASNIGKGFAYFLMALGLLYIFNRYILSGIWLIFIGFFLQEAASTSYQQMLMKNSLSGIQVQDIMSKNVITVFENLPLLSLVDDFFFRFRFTSFPVITNDGAIKGLITIHAVKDIPREKWGETSVSHAMLPIKGDCTIRPTADVFSALTKMAGNGIGRLLVTNGGGKLIGIISQRDIMRLFKLKEDLSV